MKNEETIREASDIAAVAAAAPSEERVEMTYEDGVVAALAWVLDEGEHPLRDDVEDNGW
jgi:hypothetical protein